MNNSRPVTTRRIAGLWWPLALSWMLMGVELPLVTAIVARMPDEEPNLAALSALVYPLALLIEALCQTMSYAVMSTTAIP